MLIRFLPQSRYAFGVDFSSNHLTSSSCIRVILIDFDAVIKQEVDFDYQDFDNIDEIMKHVRMLTEKMIKNLRRNIQQNLFSLVKKYIAGIL